METTSRFARAILVLALGVPVAMFPTPSADAEKPSFEGSTNVVQVEVPVNVTTRSGEPVRGLTAEDFEVFDSGKKQKLVGFDVIDLTSLEAMEAAQRYEELPAVARRHFLFLFDLSFSSPTAILKARQAAQAFVLESLHPTDLAAIATFSLEHGPRLVVTFTPDRAQLAQAIDTLGLTRRSGGLEDPLRFVVAPPSQIGDLGTGSGESGGETADIRQALEESGFESMRAIGNEMQRSQRSYQRSRISAWSRSMADMAKALNSVSGRKHIIYFSEGFDSDLLLGRQPVLAGREVEYEDRVSGRLWMVDGDETYGNVPLQNDVGDMLNEFRRADAIIQAVDASGLQADFASQRGEGGGKGADALFFLANETGGSLFEDANNLASQLERVLDRSTVTYILSFQPGSLETDGSYHRLKVKLKDRRGLRLSYRDGYYAPRPFEGLHPLEKTLLASEAIATAVDENDVAMDVLAVPFRSSVDAAYVPVIVEVDGRSLLQDQKADDLGVEIYAYVTNEDGEMRDFFTQNVGIDLKKGRRQLAARGLKYYGHLELAPGRYLLRVLVRNGSTGRIGLRAVHLDIPAYDVADLKLLPPFFVDDPDRWLLLRERRGEGQEKTVVYPFVVDGEPFVPAAKASLRRGESAELCLVAYNLEADPDLAGWVVWPDGSVEPSEAFELVERTVTGISGLDKLRAQFSPRGLSAGEYLLRIALKDPATGVESTSSIPFVVQ